LGVRFSFGVEIQRIVRDGSSVNSVFTSQGRKNADAYVVALGSHSSALLKPLGVRIPVYPVKGYSLTASIISDEAAPVSTVMDETYKTAITRLGKRVRIGGTAELAGFDHKLRLSRRRTGTLGWNLVS
jgi:D-amino-acid dehydrogenase